MHDAENFVLPQITSASAFARFAAHHLQRRGKQPPFAVLGELDEARAIAEALKARGLRAVPAAWSYGEQVPPEIDAAHGTLVVLARPLAPEHWKENRLMTQRFGDRCVTVNELLLPFGLLVHSMKTQPYSLRTIDEAVAVYCNGGIFGADLTSLEACYPMKGKRVIEFGPLDGSQTTWLVDRGARSVTCIEARPENATKTIVARQVLGWHNVNVVMDDFHNVSASTYGRFDLAFAHGVYYHSIAPFVFLDNLLSLADHVYVGGYCATEDNPAGPFVELEHAGRRYRAKAYRESGAADFYAGVNPYAYFLEGDDLVAYFREAGCDVRMLGDTRFDATQCAGRYVWFLATRR